MIYEILFSATGRTEKVLNIISEKWSGEKVRIDLSDPHMDESKYNITKDDFCIIAVSVFAGRVPLPAAENLKKIKGNGAKALLVAVYGNRAIDDCLLEMKDITTENSFRPVAAIEASVQHSLLTKFASRRPDEQDKKELEDFADKVKEILSEKEYREITVPGNHPYVKPMKMPITPKGSKKCIDCKLCAKNCPMEAIPLDNPRITDKSKCITCMRCVELCPVNARDFPKPLMNLMHMAMKKSFDGRKPNNIYIIGIK